MPFKSIRVLPRQREFATYVHWGTVPVNRVCQFTASRDSYGKLSGIEAVYSIHYFILLLYIGILERLNTCLDASSAPQTAYRIKMFATVVSEASIQGKLFCRRICNLCNLANCSVYVNLITRTMDCEYGVSILVLGFR